MKVVYTAHGTASGGGRNGTAATDDGKISVKLSYPKEMGGDDGPGTNPEQLFAVGYSACFMGALRGAAGKLKFEVPEDTTVTADVSFVDREDDLGYSIKAAISAHAPGADKAKLEEVMALAHDICPYSHLIREKHDVELTAKV
ncbi:organic hydroperoxide resistance protein [Devosia sp.]|uniref:organic hydroperoxide resistance protein n=1 Tax=Devosia sp. TaxID=1871048 RepID=UPI003A93B21F